MQPRVISVEVAARGLVNNSIFERIRARRQVITLDAPPVRPPPPPEPSTVPNEVVLRNAKLGIFPSKRELDSWGIQLCFDHLDGMGNVQPCSGWHISIGTAGTAWMKDVQNFTPGGCLGWYNLR